MFKRLDKNEIFTSHRLKRATKSEDRWRASMCSRSRLASWSGLPQKRAKDVSIKWLDIFNMVLKLANSGNRGSWSSQASNLRQTLQVCSCSGTRRSCTSSWWQVILDGILDLVRLGCDEYYRTDAREEAEMMSRWGDSNQLPPGPGERLETCD